jgi:molybdopterin synthase sulfur carrier subunit
MPVAPTVHLVFLARLREALGASAEDVALPAGVETVEGLRAWLATRDGAWSHELATGRAIRVAVNHSLATPGTRIADGDEIAFFPPVTGG